METSLLTYAIGFLAQGFFSARTLVQWILSERARRVLSPTVFWVLSLAGSVLLFVYGMLRHDFSIVLGQTLAYYIYVWNLDAKGVWRSVPLVVRCCILGLPLCAAVLLLNDSSAFIASFLHNDKVPFALLVFGSVGQVIFSFRFLYQWYYSHKLGQSVLPVGFWLISLLGSSIIITYGLFRLDPVLILGQSVGFVAYIRNIVLYKKGA